MNSIYMNSICMNSCMNMTWNAVSAPQRRRNSAGCARKGAPCHAYCRTPLLRVTCANAAATAAPPHACSDCACLPVVPDKPCLCTPVVGPLTSEFTALMLPWLLRRGASVLLRRSIQIDYSNLTEGRSLNRPTTRPCSETASLKPFLLTPFFGV